MEETSKEIVKTRFSERKGWKESPGAKLSSSKKKSPLKIFLLLIIFILTISAAYIWYLNYSFSGTDALSGVKQLFGNCQGDGCSVQLDAPKQTCLFPPFCNPELPMTNNRTNVLVVGIDTRSAGGTQNTDTIMMLSYDHIDKNVYMISIPRDTYVTYKNYFGNTESTKINAVYYLTGMIKNDQQRGLQGLAGVVGQMTGLQPHYTVLVTLQGFKDAIDALGGLKINIPEDHTDAYPKVELSATVQKTCKVVHLDGEYCVITFKKGEQVLNGEMALVYARSREYSTDYDRARRQQLVINAVKDQVLSSDTLTNPQKIVDLISSFKDTIKTSDYNLGDIIAGLDVIKSMNRSVSIILDPTFGGGNVIGSGGSTSGFIDKIFDGTYKQIQNELQKIYNFPLVYLEDPKIGVYIATTNKKSNTNYITSLSKLNLPKLTLGSKNTVISKAKDLTYSIATDTISTQVNSNVSSTSVISTTSTKSVTTFSVTSIPQSINGGYIIDYTNGTKSGTLSMLQTKFPELQIDQNINFKQRNGEDFAIIIFDSLPQSSSSSSSN